MGTKLERMIMSSLFAALTAVLTFIIIPVPFSPVPLTGQTFAVMLSGALLGGKYGALSQIIYALLGSIGLPIFSGGTGGPGHLIGPTGGYIWGFILGAFIIGTLIELYYNKHQKISPLIASSTLIAGGVFAIYIPGIIQLSLIMNIGILEAITIGALPFIPGDIIKVIICAPLITRLVPIVKKQI